MTAARQCSAPSALSTPQRSETYRFKARIAIGSSNTARRHASSHGAAHTRPQIDANGLGIRAVT